MKCYKLTDSAGRTHGDTQWGAGTRHEATGVATRGLCTDGWIHAYESPELAALLNPIHADFARPRLWLAEGEGEPLRDGQMKMGFCALTTVEEMPLPQYTTTQLVAAAIWCALEVLPERPEWARRYRTWADGWLTGLDRTAEAAAAARALAEEAGAEEAATWAAWALARAAGAGAVPPWAVAAAAGAAAKAARAAACAELHVDLQAIAVRALAFEATEETDDTPDQT